MFNNYLMHYGVKGMKWGVRRTKDELGYYKGRTKILRVYGHASAPRDYKPNAIVDRVGDDGKVNTRAFYDKTKRKYKEIHTTNHGNSKTHNFGKSGEHVVLYFWHPDGRLHHKEYGELTDIDIKENRDIL